MITNEFVNGLSLSRGGRFAGTDGPDWLIRDDRIFKRFGALSFQNGIQLTSADFFGFTRFVFRFGFTNAQHRYQAH